MCADRQESKTSLSKNIMEMKFMQRSALREIKQDSEEAHKIDDEHWVLDLPNFKGSSSDFVLEPSYGPCEDLVFGRMSFQGFNKEIEKLMNIAKVEQELALAEQREKEISVNDEEMASRYQNLVGTIAKKFTKKRNRKEIQEDEDQEKEETATTHDQMKKNKHKKSKKFLKPAE